MASPSRSSSSLRELLTHRGYWQWSAVMQLLRLPSIMTSLTFVLVSTYVTGSPAVGGLMVTVYVICATVFGPPAGRLLDRIGPAAGIPRQLGLAALALCGIAAAAAWKASGHWLLLLAGLAGSLSAGVSGAMRTLLSRIVPPGLLAPAIALDASLVELVVITAPLVAAGAAAFSPPGAVVAMVAATAAAALLVRKLPLGEEKNEETRPSMKTKSDIHPTLLRNTRFLFWLLVSVAFGHAIGTAEIGALPLAARFSGGTGGAAVLIAVLSASSALSGLVYAAFSHRIPVRDTVRACVFLSLMVAGCLGLSDADHWVTAVTALIVIGSCTAPLMAVRSKAVEEEIPPSRKSEGFSLVQSAQAIGFALGGLFLASLSIKGMLMAAAVSGMVVLALSPLLLRREGNPSFYPSEECRIETEGKKWG